VLDIELDLIDAYPRQTVDQLLAGGKSWHFTAGNVKHHTASGKIWRIVDDEPWRRRTELLQQLHKRQKTVKRACLVIRLKDGVRLQCEPEPLCRKRRARANRE
jgi:hypothetical protein